MSAAETRLRGVAAAGPRHPKLPSSSGESAQPHDVAPGRELIHEALPRQPRVANVLGDRGYRALVKAAEKHGSRLVIKTPPAGQRGFRPIAPLYVGIAVGRGVLVGVGVGFGDGRPFAVALPVPIEPVVASSATNRSAATKSTGDRREGIGRIVIASLLHQAWPSGRRGSMPLPLSVVATESIGSVAGHPSAR